VFKSKGKGEIISQLGTKCYFVVADDIDMQFVFCKI